MRNQAVKPFEKDTVKQIKTTTTLKLSKKWKERFEKEEPVKLDMSFEQAVTLALNTPLPNKAKKKKSDTIKSRDLG